MWENEAGLGFLRLDFDPATQLRLSVTCNSTCANLFGMHKEEVMSRFANRDIPVHFPGLDWIRLVLHELGEAAAFSLRQGKPGH